MTEYCMVVTTIDSKESARRLARSVVEARLAACAQLVGPIESVYWWEDALDTTEEWQVWFKTTDGRYPDLARHIGEHHSYDLPEVLRVPVEDGSTGYLSWMRDETAPR